MRKNYWLTSVAAAVSIQSVAHAVVVNGGDGTQNTLSSPPAALVNQFKSVGAIGGATGVYLGNGYVLTVSHTSPGSPFGAGDIFFPSLGQTLPAARDENGVVIPAQRLLTNGVEGDLSIYRLGTFPSAAALPGVTISSVAPAAAAALTLVGNGQNREANQSYYNVTNIGSANQTFTETPTAAGSNSSGYKFTSGQALRFGTNIVEADADTSTIGTQARVTAEFVSGTGPVTAFRLVFNDLPNEAALSEGDSGGSAFNVAGELVGLLEARTIFVGQPTATVIYGNSAFVTDLTVYKSQIDAIVGVPEPTSLGLLGLGGLTLLRRKRN